jgi:hypothetical protein
MPTKREERLQRSEAQKQDRARQQRRKVRRSRLVFLAGAIAIVAIAFIVRRQRLTENDGRVWSSAHGHWHDRNGMEIR